jgi:hypothetical protein
MDFDDLLFQTNVLLRDFPEVLYKYQNKFRYILVDEYQDTNFSPIPHYQTAGGALSEYLRGGRRCTKYLCLSWRKHTEHFKF